MSPWTICEIWPSNPHPTNSWFNSLWPSDAIWRHRSRSTLAQVMACCLTASSHYLHQYWLIISKVYWHSYEGNFARDTLAINHMNWCENYPSKISFKSPRDQWVKITSDTTIELKARKLVRHSQFGERSSSAVKARAPTSSTTKLWSNNEKKNTCSSFPTPWQSTKLQLCTTLSISITHGRKYNSGPIL